MIRSQLKARGCLVFRERSWYELRTLSMSMRNNTQHSPNILHPPDTEDLLMATVDPLNQIRRAFHPAIVRAFKESKIIKLPNPDFARLLKATENGVIQLNRTLQQRQQWSISRAQGIKAITQGQGFIAKQLPNLLRNIRSAEEIKGVVALMAIYNPSSQVVWEALDRHIAEHFSTTDGLKANISLPELEMALLASYVLHAAARKFKFDFQLFRTPKATLTYYIQLASKLRNDPPSKRSNTLTNYNNPFQHHFPIAGLETGLNAIGITPQVIDSKAIELLSLQLHLFADLIPSQRIKDKDRQYVFPVTSYPPAKVIRPDHPISPFHSLAVDLSDHALHILSLTSNPIKITSLRQIWEPLLFLDAENRFTLYRRLHQEIYHSLVTDPLQLLYEEELVCSFYSFMIKTQFKSKQILKKIYEIFTNYGMNYKDYGIVMFQHLLELEAIQYVPPSIIGRVLTQGSDYTSIRRLTQIGKGSSFQLSTIATQELLEFLQTSSALAAMKDLSLDSTSIKSIDTSLSSSSSTLMITDRFINDLLLALLCFHQHPINSPTKQLLVEYEQTLLATPHFDTIISLPMAINLLRFYAYLGRKPIPLYHKLFERIINPSLPTLPSLDLQQLLGLLEAGARLNDLPLSNKQRQAIIQKTFQKVKKSHQKGVFRLQFLWILALLQELTIPYYQELEPLVMEVYQQSKWNRGKAIQFQMLCQVYNELVILHQHRELSSPSSQSLSSSSVVTNGSLNEASSIPTTPPPSRPTLPSNFVFSDEDEMERYFHGFNHSTTHSTSQHSKDSLPPSLQRLQQLLSKDVQKNASFASHTTISLLHHETSKLLSQFDIIHTNEKLLSNYYFVDILIPYRDRYPWSSSLKKALILEIDGPNHFESFANERMGPSRMKQRHIEAKGYHVVSVPYTLLTAEGKTATERYEEIVQCILQSVNDRKSSSS